VNEDADRKSFDEPLETTLALFQGLGEAARHAERRGVRLPLVHPALSKSQRSA
jgi:hypothetical protein